MKKDGNTVFCKLNVTFYVLKALFIGFLVGGESVLGCLVPATVVNTHHILVKPDVVIGARSVGASLLALNLKHAVNIIKLICGKLYVGLSR